MKPKTHKATAKRFKITSKKKILHRRAHQDHFNAREKSDKTRLKRKRKKGGFRKKKIRELLPHSF